MTDILDEIRSIIPADRQHSATGWTNIHCPSCDDSRVRGRRGGFKFTETGGFRYYCFNAGCDYNSQAVGWEPGNGFGGRPRRFFEDMGGDLRKIPRKDLMSWNRKRYTNTGDEAGEEKEIVVAYSFSEIALPTKTQLLRDAAIDGEKRAREVADYVIGRTRSLIDRFPFMWSPMHPYHFIIPFEHYRGKIVGYVGRSVRPNAKKRFIGKSPQDYVFNQHLLATHNAKYLFVVESPLDAISLQCVATRNARLTEKQVNLIKVSGKTPVFIPDLKSGEAHSFFEIAEKNNWYLSIPNWERSGSTDITDSVKKCGLLYTIDAVMRGTTRNYKTAGIRFSTRRK